MTDTPSPRIDAALLACHSCDLLQERVALPLHGTAFCPRCGALLDRHYPRPIERPLATAVASALLFVVANAFPFMSFALAGRTQVAFLASGVGDLWSLGYPGLSLLVLLCSVVAPAVLIAGLLYLLVPLRVGLRLPGSRRVCRVLTRLQSWAMLEVYLLAVIVSTIKLVDMAELRFLPGSMAFAALIFTLTLALSSWNAEAFWERVEPRR